MQQLFLHPCVEERLQLPALSCLHPQLCKETALQENVWCLGLCSLVWQAWLWSLFQQLDTFIMNWKAILCRNYTSWLSEDAWRILFGSEAMERFHMVSVLCLPVLPENLSSVSSPRSWWPSSPAEHMAREEWLTYHQAPLHRSKQRIPNNWWCLLVVCWIKGYRSSDGPWCARRSWENILACPEGKLRSLYVQLLSFISCSWFSGQVPLAEKEPL